MIQHIINVVSSMGRRQICFMVDEKTSEEFERVKDKTGLPVARQIELKLMGYSIVEENKKTAIQLLEGTVECLNLVTNRIDTYAIINRS